MKQPSLSALTLAGFAFAAAALLAAGLWMARVEREVRFTPERAALKEVAREMQMELLRLDAVWLADLREIAAVVSVKNPDEARRLCGEFHGICAVFHLPKSEPGEMVRTDALDGRDLPAVELADADRANSTFKAFLLPREIAFPRNESGRSDGRIESADGALSVFWTRRSEDSIVALLIDEEKLRAAADAHLRRWIAPRFAGVRTAKGLDRVESDGGFVLAGVADVPERPADFVIPFVTSFGDWRIASWDRVEQRVEFRTMPLIVAAACAGILILIGVALARQQRRAQRLAEQRVSFVNQVSHELGTPLTNALLNLDLAAEQMAFQPGRARRRLALVIEDMQRLARLVGNVLTFSRAERRTLEVRPEACVPDEVIDAVLAQFAPSLGRRGIAVERIRGAGEPIVADRDALAQIAGNLISNVEKYAADGKWMRLETTLESSGQGGRQGGEPVPAPTKCLPRSGKSPVEPVRGEEVRCAEGILGAGTGRPSLPATLPAGIRSPVWLLVRVSDRGGGVPAADRARIFEPFERVSSRLEEGASGAGLGLTIARELAGRMGGALTLESTPGGGATFSLGVPATRVVIAMPADCSAA